MIATPFRKRLADGSVARGRLRAARTPLGGRVPAPRPAPRESAECEVGNAECSDSIRNLRAPSDSGSEFQTSNSALRTPHSELPRPRLTLRPAVPSDFLPLCFFFDTALRRDYFIRRGQLRDILRGRTHKVFVAELDGVLVGAAITTGRSRLVNALVHPNFRGIGIGRALVNYSGPAEVRAKIDMSTGDPRRFYESLGYERTHEFNDRGNIELMRRRNARRLDDRSDVRHSERQSEACHCEERNRVRHSERESEACHSEEQNGVRHSEERSDEESGRPRAGTKISRSARNDDASKSRQKPGAQTDLPAAESNGSHPSPGIAGSTESQPAPAALNGRIHAQPNGKTNGHKKTKTRGSKRSSGKPLDNGNPAAARKKSGSRKTGRRPLAALAK